MTQFWRGTAALLGMLIVCPCCGANSLSWQSLRKQTAVTVTFATQDKADEPVLTAALSKVKATLAGCLIGAPTTGLLPEASTLLIYGRGKIARSVEPQRDSRAASCLARALNQTKAFALRGSAIVSFAFAKMVSPTSAPTKAHPKPHLAVGGVRVILTGMSGELTPALLPRARRLETALRRCATRHRWRGRGHLDFELRGSRVGWAMDIRRSTMTDRLIGCVKRVCSGAMRRWPRQVGRFRFQITFR